MDLGQTGREAMESHFVKLNIVNVITISLAALLGYGLLVGAVIVARKLGIAQGAVASQSGS